MKITVNLDFETISELQQFFTGKSTAAITQEVAAHIAPAPEQVFAKPKEETIEIPLPGGAIAHCPTVVEMPSVAPYSVAAAPQLIVPEAPVALIVEQATVPLPPVPSPATIAPPAPVEAVPSTSALTVDKKGIPWDERIHASSKAFIADGTWRTKRGVDPLLVTQVEDELRGTVTSPAVAPAPAPMPAPAPAAPKAAPGLSPYTQLVVDVSKAMSTKGLSPNKVVEACTALGVANLGEVQQRPELVDSLRSMLASSL